MKCPKCGHENPDKELFCEECDWRLDQKYKESKVSKDEIAVYITFASIVFGLASLISGLLEGGGIFAIVFGVIGMGIGSYSTGVVRLKEFPGKVKTILLVVACIALLTAVIGFVLGLKAVFL